MHESDLFLRARYAKNHFQKTCGNLDSGTLCCINTGTRVAVAGQQAVKSYQQALGTYRDCINADIDKAEKAMKEAKSEEDKAARKAEHGKFGKAFIYYWSV